MMMMMMMMMYLMVKIKYWNSRMCGTHHSLLLPPRSTLKLSVVFVKVTQMGQIDAYDKLILFY